MNNHAGKTGGFQHSGYHPYSNAGEFAELSSLAKPSDIPHVPHHGTTHATYFGASNNLHSVQPPIHPMRHALASPLGGSDESQGSKPTEREDLASASAVEAARIQAQRTAESYASLRKATASNGSTAMRPHQSVLEKDEFLIGNGKVPGQGQDSDQAAFCGGANAEGHSADDDDDTKSSRYKRRLALNRESAAVSRIRRRAYIKELEDRLARVEKEKHELIGQVRIMLTQNDEMRSQLTECFRLVSASIPKPLK
jgi:bZIP transcription factor